MVSARACVLKDPSTTQRSAPVDGMNPSGLSVTVAAVPVDQAASTTVDTGRGQSAAAETGSALASVEGLIRSFVTTMPAIDTRGGGGGGARKDAPNAICAGPGSIASMSSAP